MDEKVLTQEVKEETTETTEERLSWEEIEKYSNYIQMEAQKNNVMEEAKRYKDTNEKLLNVVSAGEEERDFIYEQIKDYSLDDLKNKLKNDDAVESFFIDNKTGDVLELDVDFKGSKKKETDFKRDLLILLKTSQEGLAAIDKEQEELDRATDELNKELRPLTRTLSDNLLTYLDYMKEKAETLPEAQKKKQLETLRYLESGYTLDIFADTLDKYPSVKKKCKEELSHEASLKRVGKRYNEKIQRHKIKFNLVAYASDLTTNKRSLEELILIKDDQYKTPDLLVYSLIRFFSMADWNDANIRKLHASIALTLKRLVTNDFDDKVKDDIINNIVKYLKKFDE